MALIADKGISLAFEIEPGVTVDGDAARLSRMLSNLIGNAYRYGRENGRIRVTLKRDADRGRPDRGGRRRGNCAGESGKHL